MLLVHCTVPDLATAERIARALVEEGLAACVSRQPGLRSVYRWQGAIEEAEEVLLSIKTTAARFDALRERVLALHPYEVPEIVAVEVAQAHPAYAAWVEASIA
jgi:periplasmic divalent cation tolerance protein